MGKQVLNFDAFDEVVEEMKIISRKKSNDYGVDNILDTGLIGIAVRIIDKTGRLKSLVVQGNKSLVEDESIRDTFLDLGNYAIYAQMLMDEKFAIDNDQMSEENRN